MQKRKKARKGVKFIITPSMIKEYLKLSPELRLKWIQEGIVFSYQGLTPIRRRIWEKFRNGEI
jgi:hypothetical protein